MTKLQNLDFQIKKRLSELESLNYKLAPSDHKFFRRALKSESRDYKELALLTLNRAVAQRISK